MAQKKRFEDISAAKFMAGIISIINNKDLSWSAQDIASSIMAGIEGITERRDLHSKRLAATSRIFKISKITLFDYPNARNEAINMLAVVHGWIQKDGGKFIKIGIFGSPAISPDDIKAFADAYRASFGKTARIQLLNEEPAENIMVDMITMTTDVTLKVYGDSPELKAVYKKHQKKYYS